MSKRYQQPQLKVLVKVNYHATLWLDSGLAPEQLLDSDMRVIWAVWAGDESSICVSPLPDTNMSAMMSIKSENITTGPARVSLTEPV